MSDLFSSAAEDHLREHGPLAWRLRPRSVDDIVGQSHLLGPGMPLRRLIDGDRLMNIVLWGPPGTGKTTIALAIAASTTSIFEQLSAVSAGVKDVREVISRSIDRLGTTGQRTILFLDEIHRFSTSQQDALLPAVESGSIVLIGATTENPYFGMNPALLSRTVLLRLEALDESALHTLLERGALSLGVSIESTAAEEIIARCGGDARQALTLLDVAAALITGTDIGLDDVSRAIGSTALSYGTDDHYDVVSAFIKSMRGGDPQAAVVYLARMLAAGEDPRFIARRMIIFASEDIGLADPSALVQAVASARAVDQVGLPEAQVNLAQAAIYLATATKSNSVARAIWTARAEVEQGMRVDVPEHLRDSHYAGAQLLGHGSDYVNPHSSDSDGVQQTYLPEHLANRRWYEPSNNGYEQVIRDYMHRFETSTVNGHGEPR